MIPTSLDFLTDRIQDIDIQMLELKTRKSALKKTLSKIERLLRKIDRVVDFLDEDADLLQILRSEVLNRLPTEIEINYLENGVTATPESEPQSESQSQTNYPFSVGQLVQWTQSNGNIQTGTIAELTPNGAHIDQGHPYKSWLEYHHLSPVVPQQLTQELTTGENPQLELQEQPEAVTAESTNFERLENAIDLQQPTSQQPPSEQLTQQSENLPISDSEIEKIGDLILFDNRQQQAVIKFRSKSRAERWAIFLTQTTILADSYKYRPSQSLDMKHEIIIQGISYDTLEKLDQLNILKSNFPSEQWEKKFGNIPKRPLPESYKKPINGYRVNRNLDEICNTLDLEEAKAIFESAKADPKSKQVILYALDAQQIDYWKPVQKHSYELEAENIDVTENKEHQ